MRDGNAAGLRLVSAQRRACELVSGEGAERLTLAEAAAALGLRSPVTDEDLVELARACELAGVRTNLDDEPGEWREMRAAAGVALRRLAALVCYVCGTGARFTEAHGVRQCGRCGALSAARGVAE